MEIVSAPVKGGFYGLLFLNLAVAICRRASEGRHLTRLCSSMIPGSKGVKP